MNIDFDGSIDLLQSIMDSCCEQHNQCYKCQHMISCRDLWDKASEHVYPNYLTTDQLSQFIEEFHQIWQQDYIERESILI